MHINPTPESLADLAVIEGPILMLNLLAFSEMAHEGSIADGLTGHAAYAEYGRRVFALGEVFTGEVLTAGPWAAMVIGPDDKYWDEMLVVRYPSVAAFLDMVRDPEYQEVARWRTAAIADSRLIAFQG